MIYETIITSVDTLGVPHVTPFGIRMQEDLVIISPYKPSTTLVNILTTKRAVMNITDDVRVFAGALTGHSLWDLIPANQIVGVRLASSMVHKELKLVDVVDHPLRPELFLQVLHEAQHQAFQGFNRAQAAVIELAVLVSRLNRLPMDKIEQDLDYLKIAIEKTAGPRELEAWSWLIEAVSNHQAMLNNDNLA